jgi:hypothetical protein
VVRKGQVQCTLAVPAAHRFIRTPRGEDKALTYIPGLNPRPLASHIRLAIPVIGSPLSREPWRNQEEEIYRKYLQLNISLFERKFLTILSHNGQTHASTGAEIMAPVVIVVIRITITQSADRYHHFKYGLMLQGVRKYQDVLKSLDKLMWIFITWTYLLAPLTF